MYLFSHRISVIQTCWSVWQLCRIESSSVHLYHPHTSEHEQSIPVTESVLVVMTLVWLPSCFCFISACFCIFWMFVSFLSHPPSGTNARHWALLSPRPHPRVPCQNPICWQVHTCIYFLCYHCCAFFFNTQFLSSCCVLMCWTIKISCWVSFFPCYWAFKVNVTFDMSVPEVSNGKVRCHSRISGWSLCWAEDTLAR